MSASPATLERISFIRAAQRVLATLLSIQTVEGRHAAAVGTLLGKTATPDGAIAEPQDMSTVGRILGQVSV